jgi:hypothetical protein
MEDPMTESRFNAGIGSGEIARLTAQLAELREAHRNESAGLDNWRNRAEQAEAQRDTLREAVEQQLELGTSDTLTIRTGWLRYILANLPAATAARTARIATEAVEGALSVERIEDALRGIAWQEFSDDGGASRYPFSILAQDIRAALLAEPTAPQTHGDLPGHIGLANAYSIGWHEPSQEPER